MPDAHPDTIGGYRITREIGRGGMGVVFLGHDERLDRAVAIKALTDDFALDPERLARFEREARVLASLSHGNIATVYGLEDRDGHRYLVMEFVEGQTLGERLADGPLPVIEALTVCSQIAAGVEAAHDAGIVHRDLKPGNVIIRPDGTVKVLDFGLARELAPRTSSTDIAAAATAPQAMTREGVTIGTPGYMSPEQVRGMAIDRGTDNFAFGCVLFECLAGKLAFPGMTATDSIAAILEREPDWSALPDGTPPTVQLLLRRCLQKDRRRRLRDIGDARIEIEHAITDPSSTSLGLAIDALPGTRSRGVPVPILAGAVLLAAACAAAAWMLKPAPPVVPPPVARVLLEIDVPGARKDGVLSPDGTKYAFSANPPGDVPSRLWLRRLNAFEPSVVPGTDGGAFPVFSPDSRRILFTADENEMGGGHEAGLRIVGLDGRPPITIATNAIDHFAPAWLSDDEVVYIGGTNVQRIVRQPARGGDPTTIIEFEEEDGTPSALTVVPGTDWIAVALGKLGTTSLASLSILHARTGEVRPLLEDAGTPRMIADDILLFSRGGGLLATRIELGADGVPRTTGDLVAVLSDVARQGFWGTIRYDASNTGHLAYVSGDGTGDLLALKSIDLQGNVEPFDAEPREYLFLQEFSPDGSRLSYNVVGHDEVPEVWMMELDTGSARRLSTVDVMSFGGFWLPDGRLAFVEVGSFASPQLRAVEMRRNAEPEALLPDPAGDGAELTGPFDVVPGGDRVLLTVSEKDRADDDIVIRSLDGSGPPRPFAASRASESLPRISPDGRWVAFVSDESGRREVYVRALDDVDAGAGGAVQHRVSRTGGWMQFWSADGSKLFFHDVAQESLLVAEVTASVNGIDVGEPRELFDLAALRIRPGSLIPVPGTERLLYIEAPEESEDAEVRVNLVLNWISELEW